MSQNEAVKLLDKYLNNTCSDIERLKVEAWLENINNGNTEWMKLSDEEKNAYIRTLFTDLQIKVASKPNRRNRLKYKWIYWSAAAILLLAGAFGLLYKIKSYPFEGNTIRPFVVKTTGTGELKKMVLPDGTEVWLNALSELRYPSTFLENTREVYVKGEAFFKVAINADKPFIVHGSGLQIQVLGTSFDIKAYPKEEDIEVAVLSGKIAVNKQQNQEKAMVLTKNEKVSYAKDQDKWTKATLINMQDILAWRQGKLVFYHTPMKEVINALQRMYGLKIVLKNQAINHCEISGHFDIKQEPENVLKAICLSIGGKFTKRSGKVIINGPGCH